MNLQVFYKFTYENIEGIGTQPFCSKHFLISWRIEWKFPERYIIKFLPKNSILNQENTIGDRSKNFSKKCRQILGNLVTSWKETFEKFDFVFVGKHDTMMRSHEKFFQEF